MSTETDIQAQAKSGELNLQDTFIVLLVVCGVSLMSNWAGTGTSMLTALPGMLIILAMVALGLILRALLPIGLPTVAWVSLISVLLSLPLSPLSEIILEQVKQLNFLSIVTPVLAYAALAIGKAEVAVFKKSGLKIALIAMLVFTGTFLGSVIVADLILSAS